MKTRSIRTLLADDSPRVLKALSQILSSEVGFTVVGSATNGSQALHYASALMPGLVLIGLHLSKLNGVQVTNHIKRGTNPPVVFMTGSDDTLSCHATAEAAGADAFVPISTGLERLRSKLHEWFGSIRSTSGT
jgi:two-component system chemotaxis response regulator CheB